MVWTIECARVTSETGVGLDSFVMLKSNFAGNLSLFMLARFSGREVWFSQDRSTPHHAELHETSFRNTHLTPTCTIRPPPTLTRFRPHCVIVGYIVDLIKFPAAMLDKHNSVNPRTFLNRYMHTTTAAPLQFSCVTSLRRIYLRDKWHFILHQSLFFLQLNL